VIRQETLAGTPGNGQDAPIAVVAGPRSSGKVRPIAVTRWRRAAMPARAPEETFPLGSGTGPVGGKREFPRLQDRPPASISQAEQLINIRLRLRADHKTSPSACQRTALGQQ